VIKALLETLNQEITEIKNGNNSLDLPFEKLSESISD
jgi:hypothetical protein